MTDQIDSGLHALTNQNAYDPFDGIRFADERLRQVFLGTEYLVFDGAMGTMLQRTGLSVPGELPDLLSLTLPDELTAIHRLYREAGADVITTNTFGANALKLEGHASVDDVFKAAVTCARNAGAPYVAASIGPLGLMLEPIGTCSFEQAYELFAEQVRAAETAECDIILLETFTDLLELKAAVLAAKEFSTRPVISCMAFDDSGRTFLGTSPEVAAITLSALGVQALGANCSTGPQQFSSIISKMRKHTSLPLIAQPNAGMPRVSEGLTVYDITVDEFETHMESIASAGATILGSCCGSDPSYTERVSRVALHNRAQNETNHEPTSKNPDPSACSSRANEQPFSIASSQKALTIEAGEQGRNGNLAEPIIIGERINPTGKKLLKKALKENRLDYPLSFAVTQEDEGALALDVNVGVPGIDETEVLRTLTQRLQVVTTLPLCIDSSHPEALEAAIRIYAGKPLVNSVNGSPESLETVLPLVKRYGCAVVGLTLDENGIPDSAEGRFRIAERIVQAAKALGIPSADIVIDCLTMSVATNQKETAECLRCIRMVKERLGVRCVLGVSNVSFGLPRRDLLNAAFMNLAFEAGLDFAIFNPAAARNYICLAAIDALMGHDPHAQTYVAKYSTPANELDAAGQQNASTTLNPPEGKITLNQLITFVLRGQASQAQQATEALLPIHGKMTVINEALIPALDESGSLFEKGIMFLPQLLAAAEAAKTGFSTIERLEAENPSSSSEEQDAQSPIVLATVKGDIHDIGKNIVRMLLENYGFSIIDLGRNVDPKTILEATRKHQARILGLSALMTTTVPAMEETIKLVHDSLPATKIIVGGAVLTEDYAREIHADYYAKDAAETVRIARSITENDAG